MFVLEPYRLHRKLQKNLKLRRATHNQVSFLMFFMAYVLLKDANETIIHSLTVLVS